MTHLLEFIAAPPATFDPGVEANGLLAILAWGASAAGVAGIIITGILLSLQLHHGEFGANARIGRGLFFVFLGSTTATTAGPIISFFGPLVLQ
ncbi:hypothetical protein [Streptomyces tauricus]|uniref:hypothetical protein n=1 Tax=Streptomyces tauricus TaxID=68274 RepID=UPI002243C6D3|nr:hypothetical protein [Streptomyces tauricus]MCW8103312.1 hypothetical protein [Streptomyces tauricus]